MAESSYTQKMTAISVVCGIVAVGLTGWATVTAMGNTVEAGKQRFSQVVAAKKAGVNDVVVSESANGKDDASGPVNDKDSGGDKSSVNSNGRDKSTDGSDSVNGSSDDASKDAAAGTASGSTESSGKDNGHVKNNTEEVVPVSVTSTGNGGSEPVNDSSGSGKNYITYKVVWGDTLSSISEKYGISVDDIANMNGIRNVDLIYADSALRLPADAKVKN